MIDQTGTLLSGLSDAGSTSGLDAQQLQYVSQIEQNYTKRIVELLEPVVGPDNLRASVTAEVDFSQSESTSELFKPNQGEAAERSVRSQQSSGSRARRHPAAGVPGAAIQPAAAGRDGTIVGSAGRCRPRRPAAAPAADDETA